MTPIVLITNPTALFTVAMITAMTVVLVLAVADAIRNSVARQDFDEALKYIATSEFEDVDTALNRSAKQPKTWQSYWAELWENSGRHLPVKKSSDGLPLRDIDGSPVLDRGMPARTVLLAAGVALLFGIFVIKPPLGLVMPFAVILGAKVFLGGEAAKRDYAMERQLPLLLAAMRAAIQSGNTPQQAIMGIADDIPSPLGDEIRTMRNEISLYIPLEMAVKNLATRVPSREMKFLAASIEIAIRSGVDLDGQLKTIEKVVLQRTRIRQKLRSAVAQVKPTALLAYGAVPLMLFVSCRTPENRTYWFGSGFLFLIVVGALYSAGFFAIRFMVKGVSDS